MILLLVAPAIAQSRPSDVVWIPYPREGIALGQGYDLLNNRKSSAVCIDFYEREDKGLETSYDISRVRSFSETFSKFDISASGQLDLALLKASASMQFANSARTISNAERYAVVARVRRGAFHVSPVPAPNPVAVQSSSGNQSEDSQISTENNDSFQIQWKKNGITEKNFNNLCGTHYVAVIINGIDIKATITTSESSSDENSSFGGKAEVELGAFFKGKAEISGESEAAQKLHNSSIISHIIGGDKYKLPTTVEQLAAHIREATDRQIDEAARPMMIGVRSYQGIGTGSSIDAFESADTLKPAIFAYFSAREALDRLNLADEFRLTALTNPEESEGLILSDEYEIYNNLDNAYRSMVSLRGALQICRDLLREENRARVRAASDNLLSQGANTSSSSAIELIYRGAAELAEAKRGNAISILTDDRRATPHQTNQAITLDDCMTGLVDLPSVVNAQDAFLSSLVSMPFYPNDLLLDPWITAESIVDSVLLTESSETEAQSDYDKQIAQIEQERFECTSKAQQVFLESGNLDIDLDPTRVIGSNTAAYQQCLSTFNERKKELEESLSETVAQAQAAYKQISEAVARHIYRAHFIEVRRGMCGDDLGHQICAMTYPEVVSRIREKLTLNEYALSAIKGALMPPTEGVPTTKEKETKTTNEGKPPKKYYKDPCFYDKLYECP